MSIEASIRDKLQAALSPVHLEVVNESHMHNVPADSETHFKLVVASDAFDGLRAVKRHQRIYSLLSEELEKGVHALAMHTYTPDEWSGKAPDSPRCLGGNKAS